MSDLDSKGGTEQQVVNADISSVSLPSPVTPGTYNDNMSCSVY